mmetsp:Transcript_7699/g.24699  ORF Transcript_7699/g.24699 Transcript_7699/m.24699 type:complete len:228 (-) Transcript_7699:251-934(-)
MSPRHVPAIVARELLEGHLELRPVLDVKLVHGAAEGVAAAGNARRVGNARQTRNVAELWRRGCVSLLLGLHPNQLSVRRHVRHLGRQAELGPLPVGQLLLGPLCLLRHAPLVHLVHLEHHAVHVERTVCLRVAKEAGQVRFTPSPILRRLHRIFLVRVDQFAKFLAILVLLLQHRVYLPLGHVAPGSRASSSDRLAQVSLPLALLSSKFIRLSLLDQRNSFSSNLPH